MAKKVVDGAYESAIARISEENNPNFFFLAYEKASYHIVHFLIIPKFYFIPSFIEKRNPLSQKAQRSGWVGCNILLSKIPKVGQIYIVQSGKTIPKKHVLENWERSKFVKNRKKASRGWILEIMALVDDLPSDSFSLSEIYKHEDYLKKKYPKNKFIKDKIRQQLQILRNKGFIEFLGDGRYKRIYS